MWSVDWTKFKLIDELTIYGVCPSLQTLVYLFDTFLRCNRVCSPEDKNRQCHQQFFFILLKKNNTKLRSFDVEVAFPSKQTLDIENCNRNSLLRTNSSSLVVCYCVVDMCHQHKVKFSRGREKNVSYLYTSYFSPCSFLSFEWPLLNKTAGGREFDDDGKNEQLSEKELLLRSAMGKWTHLLMLKSNGKEI